MQADGPQAGRRIGPYLLLGPLGRGGMGVVHEAEHSLSGQRVALKTVQVPQQSQLQGLRREIHVLSRLRHPGIVRIFDHGVDAGLPWYAMELIEGLSLERHAVRTAGEELLREALRLVYRLCAPLAYLHGEGLVHRDLKPANVMVRAASSNNSSQASLAARSSQLAAPGWPVLVDFGLLQRFGDASRASLEVDGGTTGAPHYMAPEQVRGEVPDARADLYALGCILYELLTGKRPFQGRTLEALQQAHLVTVPRRPSTLVSELPEVLDDLVLRLLAKEPRDRLGHAHDVAAVLEPLLGADAGPQDRHHFTDAPAARPYLYRSRLGGRARELGELGGHLAALEAGCGALVLVGGESGLGKTRLVTEIGREAEMRQILVLLGESHPGGGALQPLRGALQAIADDCLAAGSAETERVFGPRGALLALYEPAIAGLPGQHEASAAVEAQEFAPLPPDAARLRLFTYLAETLLAVAGAGTQNPAPLLLILDDLQWADELTLGFLEFLACGSLLSRNALLVVATYRSEETGESLERLLATRDAAKIALSQLDEPAVGSMVGDMLALQRPPQVFSAFLCRHAEGNPFFVVEYLRTALAEGILGRDSSGRWQVAERPGRALAAEDFEALPLPRGLRDLVSRRLERLGPQARRLAHAAAVLGRELDEELLGRMLQLDSAGLWEGIGELLARQVLEELGSERLRFVHDKLWEVAYEQIEPRERRELHRAAASAMDARPEPERTLQMAVLARHWELCVEPERARACYLAAAARAQSTHLHVEAERLFRGYLRLVSTPSRQSVDVRKELGLCLLRSLGRTREAAEVFREAVAEARGFADPHVEALSANGLGVALLRLGQIEEARSVLERALQLALQVGDGSLQSYILPNLALLHGQQGRLEEAADLHRRALDLARAAGRRTSVAIGLGNLAMVENDRGRLDEAEALYREALAVSREVKDRQIESHVLGNLATLLASRRRFEEALALGEETLEIARAIGNRRREALTLSNLAAFREDLGQLEESLSLFDEAFQLLPELGDPRLDGVTLSHRARTLRRLGRSTEARSDLLKACEALEAIGDRYWLAWALCELGHLALEAGQPAAPLLRQALDLVKSVGAESASEPAEAVAELARAMEAKL